MPQYGGLSEQVVETGGTPGPDNIIPMLRRFKNDENGQIAIVGFVGNNHWIALHAQKNKGGIRLTIADSLNQTSCTTDLATFKRYVLPFYIALTQPFEEWQNYFTKKYRDEFDDGAQARAYEEAQRLAKGPQTCNATFPQFTESLPEHAIQKAYKKALSKSLRLSPEQSIGLHTLTLKIEEIMDKAQELQELLKPTDKHDQAAIETVIGEILKIDRKGLNFNEKIAFVNQLITSNVHRGNKKLEGMLTNLISILQRLEIFYTQLAAFQESKKAEELTETLKTIIPLYEPIDQKLLNEIELSSLLLELPEQHKHAALKTAKPSVSDQPTARISITFRPDILKADTLHKAALDNSRTKILGHIDNEHHLVDGFDEQGMAPLHVACLQHNTEAISALLDRNAGINLYSTEGLTPLHYAMLEKCPVSRSTTYHN